MHMNSSDYAACSAALRGGSRSFHAASRLLPRRVRDAAIALYAFCREADDAIDDAPAAGRAVALAGLNARLDAIYAGTPAPIAADRAFAGVVARYDIPQALPASLLEGFAWDAEGRRYATIEALEDYAARVAGTVGAMMALVMGVRDAAVLGRAAELGLAMQLSNIARDVGEDARAGRLYLPLDWLAEAGVDSGAFLRAPAGGAGVRAVVARLLAHAEGLYARADAGVAALPFACRPAIAAARLLYAAIGHEAGRAGFDCVAARAVVPGRRRAALVARGLVRGVAGRGGGAGFVTRGAVVGLVDAAAWGVPVRGARAVPVWRRAEAKAVWVLDLFAALGERERAGVGG